MFIYFFQVSSCGHTILDTHLIEISYEMGRPMDILGVEASLRTSGCFKYWYGSKPTNHVV